MTSERVTRGGRTKERPDILIEEFQGDNASLVVLCVVLPPISPVVVVVRPVL